MLTSNSEAAFESEDFDQDKAISTDTNPFLRICMDRDPWKYDCRQVKSSGNHVSTCHTNIQDCARENRRNYFREPAITKNTATVTAAAENHELEDFQTEKTVQITNRIVGHIHQG